MHTLQRIRAISHNIRKVAETGYTTPDTIIKNVRMHNTTGKPNHIRAHSCTQGGSRLLLHTFSRFLFPCQCRKAAQGWSTQYPWSKTPVQPRSMAVKSHHFHMACPERRLCCLGLAAEDLAPLLLGGGTGSPADPCCIRIWPMRSPLDEPT